MPNTSKIHEIYKEFQEIIRANPLLIIGTGHSIQVDKRFGMTALTTCLKEKLAPQIDSEKEMKEEWELVEEKLVGNNTLENALEQCNVSPPLLKKVTQTAGNYIAEVDCEIKSKYFKNSSEKFPIENFLEKLYAGVPPSFPVLKILTTNYDCLLEYCCDKLKMRCTTGFYGNIVRYFSWEESRKQFECTGLNPLNKKLRRNRLSSIEIYKVHGSLDWFKDSDNLYSDISMLHNTNPPSERLVVIPGNSKYEETHDLPYKEIISNADDAIKQANTFIMIGYGFNDKHIQAHLEEKLKNGKRGIIITKELITEKAKSLMQESSNLWAVVSGADNNDTVIKNKSIEDITLSNKSLWEIDEFTNEVLGGE